ncbi:MAG: hypothetical protein WBE34_16515, partial [Candidatus Nitrosopolaris sp.]
ESGLGDLYVSYVTIEIVSYIELDLLRVRNNNNGEHQEQRKLFLKLQQLKVLLVEIDQIDN